MWRWYPPKNVYFLLKTINTFIPWLENCPHKSYKQLGIETQKTDINSEQHLLISYQNTYEATNPLFYNV